MEPRTRTSTVFDDGASIRSRAAFYPNNPRLRPAESRYSLREQFAATRREYEFGFDDASSVLERSTLAGGDGLEDTVVVGAGPLTLPDTTALYRDCYELLCLPRVASLSPDQVRDAADRLIQVLAVERQPPPLQSTAAFYLGLVQAAFETLVDPSRRLGYDLSTAGDPETDSDEASIGEEEQSDPPSAMSYEGRLQEQYSLLTQRESRATTDLGLRVDASPRDSRRASSGLQLLDFSLHKSATITLPPLRRLVEKAAQLPREVAAKDTPPSLCFADPTVTITGGTHGLLDGPFKLAPLLLDRYQPPGPSIHGPRRMEQLLASRFLGLLHLNLRQGLFWRTDDVARATPDFVVEQELELLPQPSMTTRIGHTIHSPNDELLGVEVSVQKLLHKRSNVAPSIGLAIHKRIGSGTAFLVADGGDGNLRTSKECRELSRFSKVSGSFATMADVFRNPPTVEVGYAFGRQDLGIQSGQAFTKPSERGLLSLDCDIDENKPSSWSVSTGFTPGNVAAYLRYGRDLVFPWLSSKPSPQRSKRAPGIRAEVELAGTTSQRDIFIAFRALKRIGRFSKAGLELSLSPSNLHLSLYWSRLGQRISLPFLVATHRSGSSSRLLLGASARLLFWTTVLPFAALAAWNLYRQRQSQRSSSPSSPNSSTATTNNNGNRGSSHASNRTTAKTKTKEQEQDARLQAHVSRRRAEADELTVLLATAVESRQQRHNGGDSNSGNGGGGGKLVVLSAKYGARDAPPDEVADVTIAVAALVPVPACADNAITSTGGGSGRANVERAVGSSSSSTGTREQVVVIPAGLRKGRLLGFWDPAPLRRSEDKVLKVRYLWEGEEREVEVWGRDELRLPC